MERSSSSSSLSLNLDFSVDKKMKMGGELDRFSDLPEPMLHYIFSFLDMKEVVAASLVLRRWRNLWKSLPVLNFTHSLWNRIESLNQQYLHADGLHSFYTVECKNSFMDFVDKVLLLRERSNIYKFFLKGDRYCKEERIGEWIAMLSRQNTQEVHIKICPSFSFELELGDTLPETYQLPESLFYSSVKVFKLKVDAMTTTFTFQLPKSMCLADKLKSLHLVSARFPKGDSSRGLVLSCPVLENLVLVECDYSNLNIFTISARRLQNLVLENEVWDTVGSCKIKIITPNLVSLQFMCFFKDYYTEDLSHLCRGNIISIVHAEVEARSFIELLNSVCAASTLQLSGWWNYKTLECSSLLHQLPRAFLNLKYLWIKWRRKPHIDLIANLLRRSPYLEALGVEFNQVLENLTSWEDELSDGCTFHHLKSIEIKELGECENDFRFLEFLLKDAVVLEDVTVTATEKL